MATIKRFEDIHAWQKARQLCGMVGRYVVEGRFKNNFSLLNQVERSSGSIMDNIAEGFERSGNREFLQFLYIAKGSCAEFQSQMYRALDRRYISEDEFQNMYSLTNEIVLMIQKLASYLETSDIKGMKFKSRQGL